MAVFAALRRRAALVLFSTLLAGSASAAIDLRNASVERLDNGLTVVLLEDRRFPVASVQMLYRIGARDEVTGKSGLAHYLEHMAFRDSENFPGTGLVSGIYAVGGEWHGYTWIDQTTYFATVPKRELDLLLRIEADRMAHLRLAEDDMEAERGAVLAELHMYENLPSSMLIDAVNFASFLAHPYRNNTIGWESDLEKLEHRDVVEFYEQHYHPSNAVIAVVGDIDAARVRERIGELFGEFPERPPTPLPRTEEPPQDGLRRVVLNGDAGPPQFVIAYRAPSASSPEFATFLVLQAVLGQSSGVNFLQNDWGTPVGDGDPLAGAADDVSTWYPPSAQDYVFIVGGYAPEKAATDAVESAIEARIADARNLLVSEDTLTGAVDEVLDALVFDVETTEDAAHQLAFFDGLGALDTLLELPARVRGVSAGDVQRVARRYLRPAQRTIAWYLPGESSREVPAAAAVEPGAAAPLRPPGTNPVPPPGAIRLGGGLPVLLQPSDLSSSVHLRVVYTPATLSGASADDPVSGYSSLSRTVRAGELGGAVDAAAAFRAEVESSREDALDPATRLEQELGRLTAPSNPLAAAIGPVLIAVAGRFDAADVQERLDAAFGGMKPAGAAGMPQPLPSEPVSIRLGRPLRQAQHGYIAAAPGPRERGADAWRLLLYILSHAYEGRLGTKAISEGGLAYYIDSRYRSDGTNGWITMATGVDPGKLDAFAQLFDAELARLASEPPTDAEVDEAKRHLLGRFLSAAQGNSELTARMARDWLWYGELQSYGDLEQRLSRVSRDDVAAAVAPFAAGVVVTVTE